MRSPSDFRVVMIAACAVIIACDPEGEPRESAVSDTGSSEIAVPIAGDAHDGVTLEYEGTEDQRILTDKSNLRPSNVTPFEYRRALQERAREELLAELPGVDFPTHEDAQLLTMRWFVQGDGIVVQNHSSRIFSATAFFSSRTASVCLSTTPWKVVESQKSVMFSPQRPDCDFELSTVTIKDEFGFLVETFELARQESLP